MAKYTVVITDSNYPDIEIEEEVLDEINAEVARYQCKTAKEVINVGKNADGLINQYAPITNEVFNQLDNLKVVARYGIGVDNIDIKAATRNGVAVVNVPSYCEDEVSDHALALMLNCIRRVNIYDRAIKDGNWDWQIGAPITRINNLTLGIIGLGKIGRRLAPKAKLLGFKVAGYDPYVSEKVFEKLDIERTMSLGEILERSDAVSLHVPLTEETSHLIGKEEFRRMKNHATLINTSRGAVVDNEALYEALKGGSISMAGLDVIENEPPLTPISKNKLTDLDSLVMTPHAAWYSEEALVELRTKTAQGAADLLVGQDNKGFLNREELKQRSKD